MDKKKFEEWLGGNKAQLRPVVPYNPGERVLLLDFTSANDELTPEILNDVDRFSAYISEKLEAAGAAYGIGGYNEHRTIYSRSAVFDNGEEPRRLHLGVDIWGPAGTPVYSPLAATVHSFAYNGAYGDYGSTLLLEHDIEGFHFYSLYGHLSLHSISDIREGQEIEAGQWIAAFGKPEENGAWPPHLHMQLMFDLEGARGDYPGVCRYSERERYLANCPNPDGILNMLEFASG